MKLGNRVAVAAAASALVIAVGLGSGAIRTEAAVDAKTVIETRQKAMKEMGGHMKAINGFVEKGEGDAAMVAEHATAIAETSKKIPELFPEGTSLADGHGVKTAAKPDAESGAEPGADKPRAERAARPGSAERAARPAAAGRPAFPLTTHEERP